MTIPIERTRSVVQTREFLQGLAAGREAPGLPEAVMREARRLLRHYPEDFILRECSEELPESWADPALLKRPDGA